MEECPECKGEGNFRILISREWEIPEYKTEVCYTCQGNGKITKLALAVYKARGGPVPVPFQGYG